MSGRPRLALFGAAAAALLVVVCFSVAVWLADFPFELPEVPSPRRLADIELPARASAAPAIVPRRRPARARGVRLLAPPVARVAAEAGPVPVVDPSLAHPGPVPQPVVEGRPPALEARPHASRLTLEVDWLNGIATPQAGVFLRRHEAGDRDSRLFRTMYVTFGILQGADTYTTITAVRSGAREANPLLRGIAGNPTAMIAVKAAATAGTIYSAEKLRQRNRIAAIVTMAAVNSVLAIVVAHNVRCLARADEARSK